MNRTRSCFKLIRNVSMSNSSAECRRYGATVASIRNANENKDLLEFAIHAQVKQKEAFFLGANMTGKGPWEFKWIDGKPVNYTNWARKEPNDHRDQGETCIEMYVRYWKFDKTKSLEQNMDATGAGKWNDLKCDWSPRAFACRKDQANGLLGPSKDATAGTTASTLSTTATTTKRVPKLTCQDGWLALNRTRSCFKMIRNVDISKAVDECKRYGATVASAVNADENKDILEFAIMSQVQKNETLFLGAKKTGKGPSGFKWLDGKPSNFTNWDRREPSDNHQGKNEDCIEMYVRYWKFDPTKSLEQNMAATGAGKWNDLKCDWSPKVMACRKDQTPVLQAPTRDPPQDIPTRKTTVATTTSTKATTTTTTTTKATTTTVLKVCGYGWSVGPHGCYKYDGTLGSYDNRLAYCRGLNSYPTSVIDSEENRFVTDLARRGGAPLHFWTGAYLSSDHRITWEDGERNNTYSNWTPRLWGAIGDEYVKPNHIDTEHCIEIMTFRNGNGTDRPKMAEKFGIFLLFLATTVSAVPDCRNGACDALTCEAGWTALNRTRSCFKLIRNVDISKAEAECGLYGATVASVGNAEENKDILEFGIIAQVKKNEAYLLGAKKKGSGPLGFEWIDGKRFNYTNWKKGEPSDKHNGKKEECVEMFVRYWKFDRTKSLEQNMEATGAGKWNDLRCDWSSRAFACRRDQRAEMQAPSKDTPVGPIVTSTARAVTSATKQRYASCPPRWKMIAAFEKCYAILASPTNFDDAQANCVRYNATLLHIDNSVEDQFINGWAAGVYSGARFWLGARRVPPTINGTFVWIDTNSTGQYYPWKESQYMSRSELDEEDERLRRGNWNECLETRLPFWQGKDCLAITCPDQTWETSAQLDACFKPILQPDIGEARNECRNLKGRLASVGSAAENQEITRIIQNWDKSKTVGSIYYLGSLRKSAKSKEFVWLDGRKFEFAFWDANEPNALMEGCLEIRLPYGNWNDISCAHRDLVAVCEYRTSWPYTESSHQYLDPTAQEVSAPAEPTTTTTTQKTTTPSEKVCGFGWSIGPHGCYKFDITPRTYINSYAYCRDFNSFPTSVVDDEENRFVTDLAKRGGEPWHFWNGAHVHLDGTLLWADNERNVTYSNWTQRLWGNTGIGYTKPDNIATDRCVEIMTFRNGNGWDNTYEWNNDPCDFLKAVVCKKPFGY
ncbi:unnamed protein product, partial [Mesorhabditis spiculigera]